MKMNSNCCNQCVLSQITKKSADTFMALASSMVPKCHFVAKCVSHAERRPTELELKITLNGSRPADVNFIVDTNSQGECIAKLV